MCTVKLTKDYEPELFDLQWVVESIAEDFTLYDLFALVAKLEEKIPGIAFAFGMPRFELFWEKIQEDPEEKDSNIKYL